jgi:hypothetical protein
MDVIFDLFWVNWKNFHHPMSFFVGLCYLRYNGIVNYHSMHDVLQTQCITTIEIVEVAECTLDRIKEHLELLQNEYAGLTFSKWVRYTLYLSGAGALFWMPACSRLGRQRIKRDKRQNLTKCWYIEIIHETDIHVTLDIIYVNKRYQKYNQI